MPRDARSQRTRTTLILATVSALYWGVVLALDANATLGQQLALAGTTWVFLVVALRFSPTAERLQVVSMIGVATCVEVTASLALGVYRYRLDNVPLYVPPGHGLFFLMAVRLAELPIVERHRRTVIASVVAGSCALLARGLVALPTPDLLGLATWIVLMAFLLRGHRPAFYAVSYAITMALELYGTSLGNWAWQPIVPLLGLSAGSPPAGIGGAYCTMDAAARQVAPRLEGALARLTLWKTRHMRTVSEAP